MNLLFFGSSPRQLLGAYHAPSQDVPAKGAAVLCPPWGPEYVVSHRILRRLATRLSDSGYHVLRFDYYGTGDSAGERVEGDLTTWYDDASAAVDELRDLSGYPTVSVYGIRLGAVIGWRLALRRDDVRSVVMWDPVINGAAYVNELRATQAEIDRWILSPARSHTSDGVLEVLGFPLTTTMRGTIEAIRPEEFGQPTGARVTVFYSDESEVQERLQQAFETGRTVSRTETIPGQTPWRDDARIGAGSFPHLAIERMAELQR